ncbi:SRPBCC domain-containing protein [Chitinophaga sp.]|uniref:SRPBCC family protein n=1 Tax=Chitinophaga sp. TaxID=1869181 RepID=UPI0031E1D66D
MTVTINCSPATLWKVLTDTAIMPKWMGEEMNINVETSWELGSPIFIRGFHHVAFENKGIILQYEYGRILSYSHLSAVSRLEDVPENYTVLEFLLNGTELTIRLRNFPTEVIQKHLEFYWRGTIFRIKSIAEELSSIEKDPH